MATLGLLSAKAQWPGGAPRRSTWRTPRSRPARLAEVNFADLCLRVKPAR